MFAPKDSEVGDRCPMLFPAFVRGNRQMAKWSQAGSCLVSFFEAALWSTTCGVLNGNQKENHPFWGLTYFETTQLEDKASDLTAQRNSAKSIGVKKRSDLELRNRLPSACIFPYGTKLD